MTLCRYVGMINLHFFKNKNIHINTKLGYNHRNCKAEQTSIQIVYPMPKSRKQFHTIITTIIFFSACFFYEKYKFFYDVLTHLPVILLTFLILNKTGLNCIYYLAQPKHKNDALHLSMLYSKHTQQIKTLSFPSVFVSTMFSL